MEWLLLTINSTKNGFWFHENLYGSTECYLSKIYLRLTMKIEFTLFFIVVFTSLCWCCFVLALCMNRCEPNLFATSPIPHSLSCVMFILVLAFTFALFIHKCDVFLKKEKNYIYIYVVSAIVTFFLFYSLWRHIWKSFIVMSIVLQGRVLFVSVLHRKETLSRKTIKAKFFHQILQLWP